MSNLECWSLSRKILVTGRKFYREIPNHSGLWLLKWFKVQSLLLYVFSNYLYSVSISFIFSLILYISSLILFVFSHISYIFSLILFVFSLILFAFSHTLHIFSFILFVISHIFLYVFSFILFVLVTFYMYSVSSYLNSVTCCISVSSHFVQSSFLYSVSHIVR